MTENVGLSASVAHYSGDYRELADAMDDDYQGYDNSYSANVRWSTELAGAFSAGLSYNRPQETAKIPATCFCRGENLQIRFNQRELAKRSGQHG